MTSDQLDVTGVLDLGGSTLSVELLRGHLKKGDRFNLFEYSRLEGEFSAFDLPQLDKGLVWDLSGIYADGALAIVPEPVSSWTLMSLLAIVTSRNLVRRRRL